MGSYEATTMFSTLSDTLKCPVCKQDIVPEIEARVSLNKGRIVGETPFPHRGQVSASATVKPVRLRIQHGCDIPDEDD